MVQSRLLFLNIDIIDIWISTRIDKSPELPKRNQISVCDENR